MSSPTFQINDRVLAKTSPYDRHGKVGTVLDVDNDSVTVKFDDGATQVVLEQDAMFVREQIHTTPSDCRYDLICRNCGWDGRAHVWFAPHYCQEKTKSRRNLEQVNEEMVPAGSVFEAYAITPIQIFRPDGTKIDRQYCVAMVNFDESVFKTSFGKSK